MEIARRYCSCYGSWRQVVWKHSLNRPGLRRNAWRRGHCTGVFLAGHLHDAVINSDTAAGNDDQYPDRGLDRLYIIEPATPDQAEQQRLFNKMDELIDEGKTFVAVLLTHHHVDHVGAVNAVSRRYQLPVRAHAQTYRRIDAGYLKGEPLQDGDRLELGTAPDGTGDWHLKVIHTPGHALDHLCYIDSRYDAAVVGDMLSTVSTILIDPPEGHMRTYLNSLNRLLSIPIKTLYPAHGAPHRDGHGLIRYFLKHRQDRENTIKSTLTAAPRSIDQLLPESLRRRIRKRIPDSIPRSAGRPDQTGGGRLQ